MKLCVTEDLFYRKKKQNLRLEEVLELSSQLAEAVERRDEVSVKMLLSMRRDPLAQMQEIENGILALLKELPEKEMLYFTELLNGKEAQRREEAHLCGEIGKNRRMLQRAIELDRSISLRLDGKNSFYRKTGQNQQSAPG